MRLVGVQSKRDSANSLVYPIKTAVQNLKTEVAIHEQIFRRSLISGEISQIRSLPPDGCGFNGLAMEYQIPDIVEKMGPRYRLVKHVHFLPDLGSSLSFVFGNKKSEKGFIGSRRNYGIEEKIRSEERRVGK